MVYPIGEEGVGAVAKHSTLSGVRNNLTKETLLYLGNTVAMRYYCLRVSLLSCDYLVSHEPDPTNPQRGSLSVSHTGWLVGVDCETSIITMYLPDNWR